MRRLICAMAAGILFTTAPVLASDVEFEEFEVYEFDSSRLAPNDSKPTLYKIRLVGKGDALWVEGRDYNYQWLTIVPFGGIQHVKLDRRRGNPFVQETGSWIGKQLAKAGDIRGWFTISYRDRKGQERELILLAPVGGEHALADFLSARVEGEVKLSGETEAARPPAPSVPVATAPVPVQRAPRPAPAPSAPPAPVALPAPVAPPVKLTDVMTVSEFRAAGLGKLSDSELQALDAWINRYLKSRQ